MLEKPEIQEQLIISHLQDEYGLQAAEITFLPLGAEVNTAVYRVVNKDQTAYFLKLRKGAFDETSVAIPKFLKALGIQEIISPLETRARQLWGNLDDYKVILYPFIEGVNGFVVGLSEGQWIRLCRALKDIHTARVPPSLRKLLQQESYSPHWREIVRMFQTQVEQVTFDDPAATKLATFMKVRREEINYMVERAGQLGLALQERSLGMVLCHSDIHAGNLQIGAADDLYIVDWDNPILAPKERDLMFVGSGIGYASPGGREDTLFYQGYGQNDVDRMALAYYRYERIIQDIAAFCEQLFTTTAGGEDREQAYQYFTGQFLPDREVKIAYRTDTWL